MRSYVKPVAEKIEFFFGDVMTASGCYWKNDGFWSHASQGCAEDYVEGTGSSVPA